MRGDIVRKIAGIGAIIILGVIAVSQRGGAGTAFPAEIRAAREFSVSGIEPGRYLWSLRDGSTPAGDGLIEERILVFDRSDLVEFRLEPSLRSGASVEAGQSVATLVSAHSAPALDELGALRRSLVSRRDLVAAGGARVEVAAAEQRVELAEAEYEAQQAHLARLEVLAEQGLISESELEVALGESRVHQRGVDVARAEVGVAEAPARPQMLAQIDAEIAALEASITEVENLRQSEVVASPIAGTAEIGGPSRELRIFDLSTVYARVAVPESRRSEITVGGEFGFTTATDPSRQFKAVVVATAETSTNLNGLQLFLITAEIADPQHRLRPGMTGHFVADSGSVLSNLFRTTGVNRSGEDNRDE